MLCFLRLLSILLRNYKPHKFFEVIIWYYVLTVPPLFPPTCQDFALDPEETRMRVAAHHMVRNLTAGMAMITCREPLVLSISNNFKTTCLAALKVRDDNCKIRISI